MTDQADQSRRNFLYVAAGGMGAVAAGATVVPFIGSMRWRQPKPSSMLQRLKPASW